MELIYVARILVGCSVEAVLRPVFLCALGDVHTELTLKDYAVSRGICVSVQLEHNCLTAVGRAVKAKHVSAALLSRVGYYRTEGSLGGMPGVVYYLICLVTCRFDVEVGFLYYSCIFTLDYFAKLVEPCREAHHIRLGEYRNIGIAESAEHTACRSAGADEGRVYVALVGVGKRYGHTLGGVTRLSD